MLTEEGEGREEAAAVFFFLQKEQEEESAYVHIRRQIIHTNFIGL